MYQNYPLALILREESNINQASSDWSHKRGVLGQTMKL